MKQYTSKDFHKTGSAISVNMPERLIHKAVLGSQNVGGEAQLSNERQHPVKIVDLPSHSISMTIGLLEPGQSSRLHRHNYESVIYIVAGKGFSLIHALRIDWEAGDAIYVPCWAAHQHTNVQETDTCTYVACENAPMLQNLGNIAMREELES